MNKYKALKENISSFMVSQFCTKLISFIMVPIYTKALTTSEYGTFDLFSVTISVLIPILTFNIGESILRFAIDNKSNNHDVLNISFKYLFIGTFVLSLCIIVNRTLDIIPVLNEYWYFLLSMFVLSVLCTNLSYYAKAIGKVKECAFSGILFSIIDISFNLIFLLILKIGLFGYFLANSIALFIQFFYLFVCCSCYKSFNFHFSKKLENEMRSYSIPLIFNSLGWWVNNSSDRYIVTFFCGVSANGVYAVGYKIPSILNIVQTVFNQAWSISAIKEYNDSEREEFYSNVYNYYGFVLTTICSVVIVFTKVLAKLFFLNDFYESWQYVPFLTIAILFGSLSGFFGAIFTAEKNSKILALTTVTGALVNIVLNIILVRLIGPIGAAVATLVSYFVVWLIRLINIKKKVPIKIEFLRDMVSYFLLVLQSVSVLHFVEKAIDVYTLILLFFVCVLYYNEITKCFNKALRMFKKCT